MSKSFTVPQKVRENAKLGLELREKHGRGGLSTVEAGELGVGSGVQRANDLMEGSVTYETVKRMLAFFRRHETYKKYHEDKTSAAYISWMIWGGDAGYRWARDVVRTEEGVKKGSFTEIAMLGEEPQWTEDYVEDLSKAMNMSFGQMISSLMTTYKPVEIKATSFKKQDTPADTLCQKLENLVEKVEALEAMVTLEPKQVSLPEEPTPATLDELTIQPQAIEPEILDIVEEPSLEDIIQKGYIEDMFSNWVKSLESNKRSQEILKIFDRPDFSDVYTVVKKVGFASSPLISGKVKQINRQLKRGTIQLRLVPLAIKTIELKPESTEALMCGGQAFLNLLGNMFFDSINKRLVDTNKNKQAHPEKYFEGLDQETRKKRELVIEERRSRGVKPPKLYEDLPGDESAKTKPSKYTKTELAERIREEVESSGKDEFIRAASKVTGISASILEQVYDRGLAAWATSGHRPGATAEQWAIARVYSFSQGGKTQKTADKDLWELHLQN